MEKIIYRLCKRQQHMSKNKIDKYLRRVGYTDETKLDSNKPMAFLSTCNLEFCLGRQSY